MPPRRSLLKGQSRSRSRTPEPIDAKKPRIVEVVAEEIEEESKEELLAPPPKEESKEEAIAAANAAFGADDEIEPAPPVTQWTSTSVAAAAGQGGDWLTETPDDVVTDPAELMTTYHDIAFEEFKPRQAAKAMRYFTISGKTPGTRTKTLHLVFKDRTTGPDPIKLFEPKGNIKKWGYTANVNLTDAEYAFFNTEDGPFVTALLRRMIDCPEKVFGPDHAWTAQIAQEVANDKVELAKLIKNEAKMLKLCDTEEERQAEQKDINEKKARYTEHASAMEFLRGKIRKPNQVQAKQPKKEPADGFWPPSWKTKINDTGDFASPTGELYPLYPTVTIYKVVDEQPVLLYHHDSTLPPVSQWAKEAELIRRAKRAEQWDAMHRKVAQEHPDGHLVPALIKPFSKVTWILTLLGISISQGTIDISTRVSQIIVVGDPVQANYRPIGQPAPPLYSKTLSMAAPSLEG